MSDAINVNMTEELIFQPKDRVLIRVGRDDLIAGYIAEISPSGSFYRVWGYNSGTDPQNTWQVWAKRNDIVEKL